MLVAIHITFYPRVVLKSSSFTTTRKCRINFTIPSLHKNREITRNCYIDHRHSSTASYNLIIGRDLMHEIRIDIQKSHGTTHPFSNTPIKPWKAPQLHQLLQPLCSLLLSVHYPYWKQHSPPHPSSQVPQIKHFLLTLHPCLSDVLSFYQRLPLLVLFKT